MSFRLQAERTILAKLACSLTGTGRAVRSASSTLTDPMAKFRRAVERRLAYAPRFLRHYQHRRQIGCTPAVAFRSARERMRQPHP